MRFSVSLHTMPNITGIGSLAVDAINGVLANDSDVDGDALTASLESGPENGILALNSDGSFEYVPNENFSGEDSFTYLAEDGKGGEATANVSIEVTQPSSPIRAIAEAPQPDSPRVLTLDDVDSVARHATTLWQTTGMAPSEEGKLADIQFAIQDFTDRTIASTSNEVVTLDFDAAGYGWFVDLTPWDDEEFPNAVYDWQLHADADSPAAGRIAF